MLYADRVIEYSEFKQINILKKEGKMDGQLKVAAVQVTVEQNNIKKNMENVEKMAMTVAENEKNVDLILADFHLPEGTCLDLLDWMRANGFRMPFLIMTGDGDIESAVRAIKRGADDYLTKPVQSEKVLRTITGLLSETEDATDNRQAYYHGKSPFVVRTQ